MQHLCRTKHRCREIFPPNPTTPTSNITAYSLLLFKLVLSDLVQVNNSVASAEGHIVLHFPRLSRCTNSPVTYWPMSFPDFATSYASFHLLIISPLGYTCEFVCLFFMTYKLVFIIHLFKHRLQVCVPHKICMSCCTYSAVLRVIWRHAI